MINEFFQLEGAGCTVKSGNFIGFSFVPGFIGWRDDTDAFINTSAYLQHFFQELIRVFFGNDT